MDDETSPPSRAAWIEIAFVIFSSLIRPGRRLHGRRGLKYICASSVSCWRGSPPSRAAWIEIAKKTQCRAFLRSPPSRAAWIEIQSRITQTTSWRSPPSRAAWIEMVALLHHAAGLVSPPSRAAWIEITPQTCQLLAGERRRLHGRRGLKYG